MTRSCDCRNKYIPDSLKDPYALWDAFPCPPPGSKHLLFKVNWKKKLGTKQGLKIMLRLAKRCNVEVPDMYHHPGHLSSSMILITCERDCISAIAVFCFLLFVLVLGVIVFLFLRKDQYIPKKNTCLENQNGILTKNKSNDQIPLTCDKKWIQIFVRKRKDKLLLENGNKYSDDFNSHRNFNIKTHSYHKFPCDLDPPPRNRSILGDKNDFHIYEEIEDLRSRMDERFYNTMSHYNDDDDNDDGNLEPLVHSWDMQSFKSSHKSLKSDIQDISEEDESRTYKRKYNTYDRLHSLHSGSNGSPTGNDSSETGFDISTSGSIGGKSQDKWFTSLNKNTVKQKHPTYSRKDSTLSSKSKEKPVCIDYIEHPIIFCV